MTEYNIRLNPNCASVVHTGLKFKSGDKGIVFKIAVDELDTTGTTAKIVFQRANGTSVESDITGTDNVYTYTTLGNEFAVPGKTVADVKFYVSGKRESTASFVFEVCGDTMAGLGAGTAGYSDRLEQLVTEAEEAGELTERARAELETAESDMEAMKAEMAAVLQNFKEQYSEFGTLNPRGTWTSGTTYQTRDVVYHNSSSWISMIDNNTAEPTDANKTYWMRNTDLQNIISGTTPVGDSEKLGGKGASEYLNKTSIGAIGQAYRVFARMDATLNNEPETILISGGGGFSNEDGLWAVCFYARPGSNQAFIIRELIPPKTGEVKFGWYTDGNYRYFGMYTSYPYSSVPFIVKLDGKSENGTYNAEYGEFYTSATMPTGWAEVPTNKFATDADLANYALISQLFSKVKDYANLNFDTALTTSIFTSTAPPNNVGATNYPVNATGILVVFSNGGSSVTQQYFTYTGELWRRSYFTGIGWTKWDRDTTTADLAHYLPLNGGGTVSNPNGVPIVFRGATNYALAQYQKADGSYLGYLGFEGADNLVAYMSDGATNYKVLHSGNVDEYTAGSAERLNGRESSEPLTTDYGTGSVKYRFAMSPTQFEKFFPAIDNSNALLQLNRHAGGYISQLGFSSNHNIYYRASLSAAWRKILDSNNIAEHALPISGGTVSKADGIPFGVESTSDHEATLIDFRKKGSRVGLIGVDKNGVPKFVDINSAWHTLHHDGNSAKVIQATSAPSDTTAVWVDTANKVAKVYIDGAWTALA